MKRKTPNPVSSLVKAALFSTRRPNKPLCRKSASAVTGTGLMTYFLSFLRFPWKPAVAQEVIGPSRTECTHTQLDMKPHLFYSVAFLTE